MSHIWMSRVTQCHPYESVMSHTWTRHVTQCHTREWVMSHIWMIHVTHVHESCHTCEWVMPHIWMCHVTRVHEREFKSPMGHVTHINTWMTHVTHVNAWSIWLSHHMIESCLTYKCVCHITGIHTREFDSLMSHVSDINVSVISQAFTRESLSCLRWWFANESCHTHLYVRHVISQAFTRESSIH